MKRANTPENCYLRTGHDGHDIMVPGERCKACGWVCPDDDAEPTHDLWQPIVTFVGWLVVLVIAILMLALCLYANLAVTSNRL